MARMMVIVAVAVLLVALVDASVYDILDDNGLPIGLLPASVKSYSLSKNGEFEVELTKSCYANFEDQVYYDDTIKGQIAFGAIKSLSGIQAKEYFVWLPVTGIHVDVPESPYIYFEVGFLSKRLSKASFESAPPCNDLAAEGRESTSSMSLSSWVTKALNGELEITHPRKALQ